MRKQLKRCTEIDAEIDGLHAAVINLASTGASSIESRAGKAAVAATLMLL